LWESRVEKPKKLPASAIPASQYPVAQELPSHVYEGIGKVVWAHGLLEMQVSDLLFEMAEIDSPVGRVAFRYQAASERFKLVRRLITLHGLESPVNLNELLEQITECCNARDQFAHGVWINTPDGRLALRLTRGDYETPDGMADRSFIPQSVFVPDGSTRERGKRL
jgi:hypothetical protein